MASEQRLKRSIAVRQYLKVGTELAGQCAPEEVVRYFGCEALEVQKKLRGFAVARLLLHEELKDALFARCG
jgi:hypothetical protein